MLNLLGKIYGVGSDLRNKFYDRGIFKTHSLGAKTISIGNITTGGTGKTPLVAYVAEILADAGEKVCILTRGYGRASSGQVLVSDGEQVLVDANTGGDEPVELARNLIGKAIVVADADRVAAAAWAKEKFGVTAFVLDDGFQHRRARRDLDIVCIDATNPFGGGRVLPAGSLREHLESLSRAHAIVLTRCELTDDLREVTSKIKTLNAETEVFRSSSVTYRLAELAKFLGVEKDDEPPLSQQSSALVFCGLGNPDTFYRSARRAGYNLTATETFRDHYFYTQADIDTLHRTAREQKIEMLLTTAKDAVKLSGLNFSIPCFVMEIQIEIDEADAFRRLVISS